MSTPRAFHGSVVGILDRGDLDLAQPEIDRVADDLDLAGKAAMDAVEAQQMGVGLDRREIVDATTSMSLRLDSSMARRMLRPMRPKPLMATLTDISRILRVRS